MSVAFACFFDVSEASDRCPRIMFAVQGKYIITLISSLYLASVTTGYSDRWIPLFFSLLLPLIT